VKLVARPPARDEAAANETKRSVPSSRDGKRALTVHVPDAVRRAVKGLAAEQGRSSEDVVAEGLNMVFTYYGKPEIAERKKFRGAD
jgi:hypothetical protein